MARGPHSRATGRLWWYGVVLSQVWMNALGARYIQRLFILVPGSCISGPWGGRGGVCRVPGHDRGILYTSARTPNPTIHPPCRPAHNPPWLQYRPSQQVYPGSSIFVHQPRSDSGSYHGAHWHTSCSLILPALASKPLSANQSNSRSHLPALPTTRSAACLRRRITHPYQRLLAAASASPQWPGSRSQRFRLGARQSPVLLVPSLPTPLSIPLTCEKPCAPSTPVTSVLTSLGGVESRHECRSRFARTGR